MKKSLHVLVLLVIILLTTQCQQTGKDGTSASDEQMEETASNIAVIDSLVAILASNQDTYSLQDSIQITFTVNNPTEDTLKFTQYHTPFEGFISNFLEVKDSAGNEVKYIGAMAKRVSPPPAETYHTLAPGEQESISFDLKKGYALEKPGTYTLEYTGGLISGIASGEILQIEIVE